MLDWLDYRKQLVSRISELGEPSLETLSGYLSLAKAGETTGRLDPKIRELIAVAVTVAVTAQCGGCVTVHTGEALKLGASREEIAETLGVAIAINAGAALTYSARVMDAVSAHSQGGIS